MVNIKGTKMDGSYCNERFGQALAFETQVFLFGRKERKDRGDIDLSRDLYVLDLTRLNGEYEIDFKLEALKRRNV